MKAKKVVYSAIIAAMYVALTYVSASLGLASGSIQVRLSEVLTILPFFTPYAIWGLVIGCFVSNVLTGCLPPDIVFGTIATLIGAVSTYYVSKLKFKSKKWFAPVGPILSNAIIIPFVLKYAYGLKDGIWFMFLTVGAGEVISCGLIGMLLLLSLEKRANQLF